MVEWEAAAAHVLLRTNDLVNEVCLKSIFTFTVGQGPGAELLEIRHQAGHRKFLEAPPTLFIISSLDPHQRL